MTNADEPSRIIAERVRQAREYVGLSQNQVATHVGIPRSAISAIESGKRQVSSLELHGMARLFHRDLAWFYGEDDTAGPVDIGSALYRATSQLSERDRDQVLAFAQFLANAGRPENAPDDEPELP